MKQFSVFQIKDDAVNARYIKFSSLELLEHLNLRDQLRLDLYEKVYEGEMPECDNILDAIFSQFQGRKPADFKGHSISVSDIVLMDGKYYYCDSYGWEEINL